MQGKKLIIVMNAMFGLTLIYLLIYYLDENEERTEYNDSSQYNNNNTYLYYPERMMNVEETQLKPKKVITFRFILN